MMCKMNLIGKIYCLSLTISYPYLLVAGEDIFLVHPQNKAVNESENATFSCCLSDLSFRIHWLVNDTDAEFGAFYERGVTIRPTNATASELHIYGQKENNNTLVQCVALLYQNYRLRNIAKSDVALLTITAAPIEVTRLSPTLLQLTMSTSIPGILSKSADDYSTPNAAPHQIPHLIIGISASAMSLLLLLVLAVVLLSVPVLIKRDKGEWKTKETPCNDIEPHINPLYEYRRPVNCHHNPAYEANPRALGEKM